jgi:hypothetical protein
VRAFLSKLIKPARSFYRKERRTARVGASQSASKTPGARLCPQDQPQQVLLIFRNLPVLCTRCGGSATQPRSFFQTSSQPLAKAGGR